MLFGILGDTHSDNEALPYIIKHFKELGVSGIVHCGDIEPKHLNPSLFLSLPVICALTEEQSDNPAFKSPPVGWTFTRPGDRVRIFCGVKMYVGHKRSFTYLMGSEQKLMNEINEIRKNNDGVSWMFAGHTHRQIFDQGAQVSFVNPGAVWSSLNGYEYAVVNSISGKVIFCRIPKVKPSRDQFCTGVISDSLNVSEIRPDFWEKLVLALETYGVKTLIHCGNIKLSDIGRPELKNFQVYFNLRKDQIFKNTLPSNWVKIPPDFPVVEVDGHKLLVQLDFGALIAEESEVGLAALSQELLRKYPEISFILCGFTRTAFLEEGELVWVVNPGDAKSSNFAVISFPTEEVVFDNIPFDPLPSLAKIS